MLWQTRNYGKYSCRIKCLIIVMTDFHKCKKIADMEAIHRNQYKIYTIYVIEGSGALVNEKGEETPLKAGDFALVLPDEKHQYRNKGMEPFKMICGVPKEFE